tara:strand:- start:9738 stop:10565 length:828 start_codon:yes stop_codon:yes gene_type:complete
MKKLLLMTLVFFGQKIFFVRGKLRNALLRIINSIINYQVSDDPSNKRIQASVNGVPFHFYFDGMSDTKQIFGNYNKKEIKFIKNQMKDGSIFIDIGSNIGFYSQNIASIFPKIKFEKIISIEPNPILIKRHSENLSLLNQKIKGMENKIYLENYAIGESNANTFLDLNEGYGSARVIEKNGSKTIPIKMKTLLEILEKNNIKFITCLKIDIEGHEDKALLPFFKSAPKALYPEHIVLEYTSQNEWRNKDFIKYIINLGYIEKFKTRGNICLSLNI